MKKILMLICGAMVFTGCATTSKPSDMGQLQIKVAQLERKVEERDRDIEDLKMKVESMAGDIDTLEPYPADRPDYYSSKSGGEGRGLQERAPDKGSNEEIIRVDAGAKSVQTALKNAGYYTGNIDGKIGAGTKQAIKQFQKDNNLQSDGIVGSRTWTELKAYLN